MAAHTRAEAIAEQEAEVLADSMEYSAMTRTEIDQYEAGWDAGAEANAGAEAPPVDTPYGFGWHVGRAAGRQE